MKKTSLFLKASQAILFLGLTVQAGYSMDCSSDEISTGSRFSRQEQAGYINRLPNDMLVYIISLFPKQATQDDSQSSYNTLSLVCKKWQKITDELTTYVMPKYVMPKRNDEPFLHRFANLTSLNLMFNNTIKNEGLQYLPNLTSLDLRGNNTIKNEELQYLSNLTSLNLAFNNTITNEGLQYLSNLTSLNLVRNQTITNEGLQYLPNLTRLNLKYNNQITLTDDELKALLPNLVEIIR